MKSEKPGNNSIEKHAKECEKWSESVREACRHELKNARTAHKNGIRMWLIEQGWEPEMAYFDWDFIARLRIIREPRWLIPRSELPPLKSMLKLRDIHIEKTVFSNRHRTLIEAYKRYLKKPKQPGTETRLNNFMPHFADVSAFQPFDAIIRSRFNKVITAKHFTPAFAELPTLISTWRQRIEAELVECYLPPLSSSVTGEAATDAPSPATCMS
ncbi:hypothetical protein SERLA73DRAFT_74322 [Serpula lacrymans var. lacrymans S7.3]|uniref:Uncharacterized protein n=2 Tax=Serpula lacrymans var. lacrymans TaxID=341189 RepID=F8Q194_SERL3|nr:uncharacterized protein SERLADRAFT_438968 [Serpula lacrymans var. lacrymans S7.9]EGN98072.1 hypothetical protein SERLA73DRAFT_74322 [Serpula lacrymans var. lacrymans S7.3]EGO23659.1 hypothetical protein SERLADRAFT_438968 [Serpula lacrymans var. lacrymans S7.9]